MGEWTNVGDCLPQSGETCIIRGVNPRTGRRETSEAYYNSRLGWFGEKIILIEQWKYKESEAPA